MPLTADKFNQCLVVFRAHEEARREIGGTEVHLWTSFYGDPSRRHVDRLIVLVKIDYTFVPIIEAEVMDAGILV